MITLVLILSATYQAPPPPQAPQAPAGFVVVAKSDNPCGKRECPCGCKDGYACICAAKTKSKVEAHNYSVNGKVVQASSWAEAYKLAGVGVNGVAAPSVEQPVVPAPSYAPVQYAAPVFHQPQQFSAPRTFGGGFAQPSFQGFGGGASCAGGR